MAAFRSPLTQPNTRATIGVRLGERIGTSFLVLERRDARPADDRSGVLFASIAQMFRSKHLC